MAPFGIPHGGPMGKLGQYVVLYGIKALKTRVQPVAAPALYNMRMRKEGEEYPCSFDTPRSY